ncbi:MAG: hypothetical protein ACQEXG_14875 [Pseudomonadota bacterium]
MVTFLSASDLAMWFTRSDEGDAIPHDTEWRDMPYACAECRQGVLQVRRPKGTWQVRCGACGEESFGEEGQDKGEDEGGLLGLR